MIGFKIIKKSSVSWARYGLLTTPHGTVETPTLVPVATQAVIKTLTSEEVKQTNTQILINNTFHLSIKPGEKIIKNSGGLHKFMNWDRSLMTDSGGFQVFSLGFGRDLKIGKLLKYFPGKEKILVTTNSKPRRIKIDNDGVEFQSPVDGKTLYLGPKESIAIQEKLGADIMFAFDECTPPLASYDYVQDSLTRTHAWAKKSLAAKRGNKALYGIVQGSRFKELRISSATYINSLDFNGFGMGGDMGLDRKSMVEILSWIIPNLDDTKPRHMLGIGYPEDIPEIVKMGIDTFDCTVPTLYARHGVAFTSTGKLNIRKEIFLRDQEPLDKKCLCFVCQSYKRSYICHLFRAHEITGMKLLTSHNLYFFNNFVTTIREKIKDGKM